MFEHFFRKKDAVEVHRFNNKVGNSEIALLSFEGNMRDAIIDYFDGQYQASGSYIKNGGSISPKTIMTLAGGGAASLKISSAKAGNLFMATADPATLMKIGDGVGSAVMGAGGIIKQAPFIAASNTIVPIIGPLIAYQTLSTITIINEFKDMNKNLYKVEQAISELTRRIEATHIAQLISSSNRIIDIEKQFLKNSFFTNDMTVRLAILEDNINKGFERYNFLYSTQHTDYDYTSSEWETRKRDSLLATMYSVLDIRVELLRLQLIMQENPMHIGYSVEQFREKIDLYQKLWDEINNDANIMLEKSNNISNKISEIQDDMNMWQEFLPEWLSKRKKETNELENLKVKVELEGQKHKNEFNEFLMEANKLGSSVGKELDNFNRKEMSLIYWEDNNGTHSYYTNDLMIESR